MFDQKTFIQLGYYVYALIDPVTEKPFYIGKGKDNRVFNHIACALDPDIINPKYETIRAIQSTGKNVKHIIIRHGLTEHEALEIEAAIIDLLNYFKIPTTNLVSGQKTLQFGVMSTDDVIRLYNAKPLTKLKHKAIIINLNSQHPRNMSAIDLYNATRQAWAIDGKKTEWIKVV